MVTRKSEDTIEGWRELALPGSGHMCRVQGHGGNRWDAGATLFERREARLKARTPSIVREQGQEGSERTIHG
jgi:hypothetical protein